MEESLLAKKSYLYFVKVYHERSAIEEHVQAHFLTIKVILIYFQQNFL